MLPFIEVFDLKIPSYGLLLAIGMILGILLLFHTAKYRDFEAFFAFSTGLISLVGGLVGAFLLYLITIWDQLIQASSWNEALSLMGGLVFYGGLIGGFLASFFYTRAFSLSLIDFGDLAVISLALAHSLGRLGCFAAGCCFGVPHSCGVVFTKALSGANHQALLPVQLIESAFTLALSITLYLILRRGKIFRSGLILIYAFSYSAFRFVIEFYRGDVYRGVFWGLSTSQWISIVVFCLALTFYLLKRLKIK